EPCYNCVFILDPAQEQRSCLNATVNAGGYSGFRLHLSGDEDTPAASIPTGREVLPFSLHLSSESAAQLSSVQANVSPQILNSGACKGQFKGSYVDGQVQEIKAEQEAKSLKDDKQLEVRRVASKDVTKPLGARKHQPSGGKVDVQKLRKADANDAVELSIAASEAMVIAEMILDDCQPDKLTAAALEAALRVKEARKQCFLEEIEHDSGSFQNGLDESDWLAELDEIEMLDVFKDVGLCTVQTACSSQGHNTTNLKQSISQPSCAPHDVDICSSEEQNKEWRSQDDWTSDHVPDSLAENISAGTLVKESSPGCVSVKQPARDKLRNPVRGQNITKEAGRIVEETKFGGRARKHIRTSFISESMDSMNECSPAPRAVSTEMVASSRASFLQKNEGFHGEDQSAESCHQVVCSSLSPEDPLCSFVPCSISCNEVPTSQPPECKQRNEENSEPVYRRESLKNDLDVEAGPSSVPLDKTPESNPWRRRIHSSLRPFSMLGPISNISGGSLAHNDVNVAACQKERGTTIILNKKIQRIRASNQFIENNAEAGSLNGFSLVQKKSSDAHDDNEHHSKEQYIPSEVLPQPTTYLSVGKRGLKRKGPQLLNAKLSTRQTKSRRVKSRFSWSESRVADMQEPRECTGKKEALFHGLEFLVTGFQSHKEKEIVSVIRKFGGCVLSKVPPCPFDKKSKLAELVRWKPPVVLSPKKVSTAKFLYGCATDSWILNSNWLFDSLQAGLLLPPGKYLIRQRHTVEISTFGQSVYLRNNKLVFHGVGFLIHGKISFCSKFSNIIKHGGGQVFVSLQGLIQSLKDKSCSRGIILVANEASASRHLSHCGLEHDIKTAPASWIIGSLFSGKLIHLKKDRCAPFRRIKMPSFQQQRAFEMSQEI
uniref:BRCT domain-containing protein n=1 Tax=Aegilops tauschii subsp. strangulata TaxID=200361 RepID=A0A453M7U0_AEGTS